MQGHDSWSIGIGRWMGVPVRLHFCLFLFIVFIFAIEWHFVQWPYATALIPSGTALATILGLLVAILVHELAHVFAAINLGGSVRKIVLTPWGGQSEFVLPNSARAQAVVYAAGPFANLMLFAMLAAALIQLRHATLFELMNPFRPHALSNSLEVAVLKIFCWVNFQVGLVNFLPAYPLDGSQLLRMFVWGNNKLISRHRLETAILAIAHMVAVALFVLAWFSQSYNVGPIQPTWAVLVSGGLILMFASRFEFFKRTSNPDRGAKLRKQFFSEDELIDFEPVYDDDGDEESLEFEQDPNDTISQWLRQKQEERQLVEYEIEKEDELRADGILEKLYRSGKESLTEEERSVLHRVSDRYRRRRRQLPS